MSIAHPITVLGSSGFLGSSIAASTLGIDIRPSAHTDWVTTVETISQEDWNRKVPPESTIVFAIGRPDVRGSLLNPVADYQSYVAPLHHLLKLLHRGEHLVLISSAAVYSGQACPETGFREEDQVGSASIYGWHRILAEHLVTERAAHANGEWTYSILRPFSMFGEGLNQQVVHDLTQRIQAWKDGPLTIRGTGNETRDFIHSDALATILTPLRDQGAPQVINLCSGSSTTIRELAESIRELIGSTCTFEFDNTASQPADLTGNATRTVALCEVTDFGLDQRLKQVVAAYCQ